MNAMQVLIVDDNRSVRLLMAECVVSMGHAIAQVENGQEALNYIKQNTVDLMIIALESPGLNGFEATKAIRALHSNDWFPVIMATTALSDEVYARGVKAGGDAFLEKPFNPIRLQAQITAMERIYYLRKKCQAAEIGLVKLNDTLKFLAMFDQLTGLANRRNCDETLRREFKLARRDNTSLALLKCDIDFFKQYTEKYGQKAGDACLSTVASALASASKRPTDLVCRYSEDTFVIILPRTDVQGAKDISEKIRKALLKRKVPHQDSPVSDYVTLSIGKVVFNGQFEYVHELNKALEEALQRAKANGHDRIECHP